MVSKKIKSIAAGLTEPTDRWIILRTVRTAAGRFYRFLYTVYLRQAADRISLLRYHLFQKPVPQGAPLSYLTELRRLERIPAPDPFQSWEEVNLFNRNQRGLLAWLLGPPGAETPDSLAKPPDGTGETVDDFLARLAENRITAVSFDLFDTLVRRRAGRPHDLFSVIDRKLSGNWPFDRTYSVFRIAAEAAARKSSSREEVTLEEIYEELRRATGLGEAEIRELRELEIATELKFIRPDPLGGELLQKAREHLNRIYLLSDIYLPQEVIDRILDSCGLGEFSGIYLSSERKRTKHSGRLFELFLEAEGLTPHRTLHVGDNRHSDLAVPAGLGIKTFFLDREPVAEADLIDSLFSGLESSRPQPPDTRHAGYAPRYGGDPYRLGYRALGSLLLGFTSLLHRTVVSGGVRRLYFVSRDGYYFQAAYELLRQKVSGLPPSEYLYASRKLIYAASMTGREKIAETANRDYFPVPLRQLLTGRLLFSKEECRAIPAAHLCRFGFSSLDEIVDKNRNHRQLLELALSLEETIIAKSRGYRERYLSYLGDQIRPGKGLLVDIGYNGTLQQFIRDQSGRSLEGLYLIVSPRAAELDRAGLGYRSYLRPGDPLWERYFRHVQLCELFLSGRHPSVVDLRRDRARNWEPVYEGELLPAGTEDKLRRLHEGALAAVGDFLELAPQVLTAGVWPADRALRPLLDYLDAPDYEDCRYWDGLRFEDSFGGRGRQHAFSPPGSRAEAVWKEAQAVLSSGPETGEMNAAAPGSAARPEYLYAPLNLPPGSDRLTLFAYFPNSRAEELEIFLTSLHYQIYPNWTLLIGLEQGLKTAYEKWRAAYRPEGGLITPVFLEGGDASPACFIEGTVAGADYGWGFFCLPGVRLKPEALAETALAVRENPERGAIYCDEIESGETGLRRPFFKPDWSPELLIGQPYVGGFWGARKAVLDLRRRPDQSWETWLREQLLRISEREVGVFHLPRALYEFRRRTDGEEEDYRPVIQGSLERRAIRGRAGRARAGRNEVYTVEFPDDGPSIAIIIPTRNRGEVLQQCLSSLRSTTYQNYRVYLVDNGSDDPETLTLLAGSGHRVFRLAPPGEKFNYSFLNNQTARRVGEDYLLFLNNDTEVINPRWLSQLAGWLQFPGVAAAGGRLLFADGRVQHAGIVNRLLYRVLPAPAFKLIPPDDPGYHNLAVSPRNCSALTAACLLTPRKIFLAAGGFDEKNFAVAYNDCDYGFRLTRSGARNVFCPEALLYHHEGTSRGVGAGNDDPAEEAACVRLWGAWEDPYYNPNLSREGTDFQVSGRRPYRYPRKKSLRILMFSHNFNYEGASLVLFEIARGLKNRGHRPLILSPAPGPLLEKYRKTGVEAGVIGGMDLNLAHHAGAYAGEMRRIVREAGRLRAEVIAANTVLTWWGAAAAGLLEIPYLWIIHESEPPFSHPGLKLYGALAVRQAKAAFYRAYQNIFVADSTRRLYRPYARHHNLSVVHNSFDPGGEREEWEKTNRREAKKQLGIKAEELCVLTPGTVCARKAQLDLVAMIALLPERATAGTKFLIVGDRPSPYSKSLHRAVSKLPRSKRERVEIIPETGRIARYYLAADILAFPSRLESFPRVIQEAMFTQLAIVTTPVFGIREMVGDEVSALFFPPGDIGTFADRMARVLESAKLREKLGKNAAVALGKLPTPTEMIDHYEELFLEAWLSGAPRKLR